MRCSFRLPPNSSVTAVEHCTYMQSLGVLNEPRFISKTGLAKITLCNDDGILQVRLQGVIIIDLVPQKHKEAEQRDTKQCDCTEGHKNAFTTFILFWWCRKAPCKCNPCCQTDQTNMGTQSKPDHSVFYFCYPQIEESCPRFLSRSLCHSLYGIILLIITDAKERLPHLRDTFSLQEPWHL